MSSRDFRMDAKYIATTFQSASSDMGYIILCEQTKRHVVGFHFSNWLHIVWIMNISHVKL